MAVDRRQQVVDAASRIAAERGFGALSVRAVAARAGIGASTLRHYYPTQRDLYDAVVRASLDAQLTDGRVADRSVPPGDRLVECLAQLLPRDEGGRGDLRGWLALHTAAVGPGRSEEGARLLAALTRHGRERVDGWLAVLGDEGALRPVPREQLAVALLAVVDGLCLALVGGGALTVADAHRVLADAVERLALLGADLPGEQRAAGT